MRFWIGFDVGKVAHWVVVVDDEGGVVLSRKVEATEADLENALSEIAAFGDPTDRAVGIDIVGGPATMLQAALLERGERLFYLPGTAVNEARKAYRGGEHKSDPGDARVIADQLRFRWRSLQEVQPKEEGMAEMRILLAHRRDLVQDKTRQITRLRATLVEVFPGMEAVLDLTKQGPLVALTRVARPAQARRLGKSRLARWLKGRGVRKAESIAARIAAAAEEQRRELPAAQVKAEIVAELAAEVLRLKERIEVLDGRLKELMGADPKAKIVRSLPGMGLVLTAEFLAEAGDPARFGCADRLAAAAGISPVLRSSGKTSYRRRARRGNRLLKRVFYQSAFLALADDEPSKVFYRRKRAEGKNHRQAVIALARRRVNVLWAMLRDGSAYERRVPKAA
jgi:transposase